MKIGRGDVALITGASRGIGRHIALALARRGMDLVLLFEWMVRKLDLPSLFRSVADQRRAAAIPDA